MQQRGRYMLPVEGARSRRGVRRARCVPVATRRSPPSPSMRQPACSVHCHAATKASKVKKVDLIRQCLRMCGFMCILVYMCASTRLNVIPFSVSRPRALRYLSIQWGVDLSKVAVLVGETGNTDRERLLPGLQRRLSCWGWSPAAARSSSEAMTDTPRRTSWP